jgi:predicted RNA-binding Zn ribbon-like protein
MSVTSVAPVGCDPRLRREIDLLVGFVTSTASNNGRLEEFDNERSFASWADENELGDADANPTDSDAAAARELRTALITVFRAHCDCDTAPVSEAESFLERSAKRYPVTAVVSANGVQFEAAQGGVPGMFGALLAASAEVSAEGFWPRLKMCKNPSCYAGFYDKTRNLSGQFCSAACNSQVSMRAYRQRLKTA